MLKNFISNVSCFGNGSGTHGSWLLRSIGLTRVVINPMASTLSPPRALFEDGRAHVSRSMETATDQRGEQFAPHRSAPADSDDHTGGPGFARGLRSKESSSILDGSSRNNARRSIETGFSLQSVSGFWISRPRTNQMNL